MVCDIRSTGVTSPYPHGIIGSVSGSCVKRGRRAPYPTNWTFPSASSYSKSHPHLCAQQDGLSPPGVYSGLILASVTAPLVSRGRSCVEPSCPSKLPPRKPREFGSCERLRLLHHARALLHKAAGHAAHRSASVEAQLTCREPHARTHLQPADCCQIHSLSPRLPVDASPAVAAP